MPRRAALCHSWLAFTLFYSAVALGPLEPDDGKVYLGAWPDTTDVAGDSPSAMNARLGLNLYAYQLSQEIPVVPYDYVTGAGGAINQTFYEHSNTSAAIYLTVYPSTLTGILDSDLTDLGNQIASYQREPYKRGVFLRWAPEMQGQWFDYSYGVQPTAYVAQWKRMYTAVKAIAPNTAIVWSPNVAQGYPFSQSLSGVRTAADRQVLDTNNDNRLNRLDDAYAPYFPGADFVDWVGMSAYWKGTLYPYTVNEVQPAGFADGAMTGNVPARIAGQSTPQQWSDFYNTYCAGLNKPCMFSEMGAAYHLNSTSTGTATQLDIQTAWWRNTLTNATFLDTYPKIKMFMLFEHLKFEDRQDLRDFRITNATDVRNGFLADLQPLLSRYVFATSQNDSSSTVTPVISTGGTQRPNTTNDPTLINAGGKTQPVGVSVCISMVVAAWFGLCQ